jgi:hypothetical protein
MAYSADPDKHRRAAGLLDGEPIPDADESTLSNVLIQLMKDIGALAVSESSVTTRTISTTWSTGRSHNSGS